ncbi:hypothetical protein C0989_000933, partial [Termitomyces sp. Mn162]
RPDDPKGTHSNILKGPPPPGSTTQTTPRQPKTARPRPPPNPSTQLRTLATQLQGLCSDYDISSRGLTAPTQQQCPGGPNSPT